MNQFANSLLTVLLGWMRSLFSSFLSLGQGIGGGFLAWMSRRWFVLAVILILAGLTIDAMIYILRWHPQNVWRSKLHLLVHRRKEAAANARFNEGYDTALTDFNFADTPIAPLVSQEAGVDEMLASYYSPEPVAQQEVDLRQLPGADSIPIERRRRSSRHGRRTVRINFRLPDLSESGRNVLYPEPPINAREAFREPVYPAMENLENQEDEFNDE